MHMSLRLALPLLLLASGMPGAAEQVRTERVRFAPGKSAAVVEGRIRGHETVDYLLRARAGQAMNVSMATSNGANYFNILAPGETQVAFFNGSVAENQFEGVLPRSGDYTIRVYLMRSAARRNEAARYRLEMIVQPDSSGLPEDARVSGTTYHATGDMPCAEGEGQPMRACPFGVERKGTGSAVVTITRPGGAPRRIVFEHGRATQAGGGPDAAGGFRAERQGDLTVVRIGEERYEIPDAVVDGG